MNGALAEHEHYLVGNVVNYDIFAKMSPQQSEAETLDILLRLHPAECDGIQLHEYHRQRGCRERFSEKLPGATLWKGNPFVRADAKIMMDFPCEDVGPELAGIIHRLTQETEAHSS